MAVLQMAMKGFTEKIVNLKKSEQIYESQGGPIILFQIENEYGPQSKSIGSAGYDYMTWTAKLAVRMDTGVPWVMCKEDDAPGPVMNFMFMNFTVTSLGSQQEAHIYYAKGGDCAAFLSNYDSKSAARVLFNDKHYNLPPWSISILPDCHNVVFNTAKTSKMEMLPSNVDINSWETYNEDISSMEDSSVFTTSGLLEQINVTRDSSDYTWYITR
ncbi:hypothetical protein AgCh_009784 [Apium graveolens]